VPGSADVVAQAGGDFVRAKNKTAQVSEVLLKIVCHNIRQIIFAMFELGIEAKF